LIGGSVFVAAVLPALPAYADVTISNAATQGMSCSAGICTPTVGSAVLNVGDLENLLAAGNVEVSTTGAGIQASDIRIADKVFWTNKSRLALDAYHSIAIGAAVSIKGKGGLSLVTNDGGDGGALAFGNGGSAIFTHLSSALTINGTPFTLVKTLPRLASAIAADPSGAFALARSYNARQDGTYRAAPIGTAFTGTFNGLGNTISKLTISSSARKNTLIGLFADVDSAGIVGSVRITGVNIVAKHPLAAGPLAGENLGTVYNVFTSGQIQMATQVADVVGGLVGYNQGLIEEAGSVTTVSAHSNETSSADAGGLVGDNYGTIDQSYATGSVTTDDASVTADAGALAGLNVDLVENSYAMGAVNVPKNSVVGGLVGLTTSTIAYSYSTGAPTGGSGSYVGGLVGYDDHQANGGNITDDYWDMTTSGITDPSQGAGNVANDPGITGETTEQLQSGLPAGFDPAIWAEDSRINNGLPYLIANPPVQ
jgi:hypothetical protein